MRFGRGAKAVVLDLSPGQTAILAALCQPAVQLGGKSPGIVVKRH